MEDNRTEADTQMNESEEVTYAETFQYDDSDDDPALRFVQDLQKLVHQSDWFSRYAFRGHACASHKLVPSLLRHPSVKRIIENESFFRKLLTTWELPVDVHYLTRAHEGQLVLDAGKYTTSITITTNIAVRLLRALAYQYIEDRLVKEFLQSANKKVYSYNYLHNDSSMPPPTPISSPLAPDLLPIGNPISNHIQRLRDEIYATPQERHGHKYLIDLFSIPSLKQQSIAAHEEVPTSALDFTQDPLIAAWFACTHRIADQKCDKYDTEYISVIAFNQYQVRNGIRETDTNISPFRASTYDTPKHGNDRAQAQKSILCRSASFYHRLAFLDDVCAREVLHHQLLSERWVYQFKLHKSLIPDLFKILSANGIDDAFVMQRTSRLVREVVSHTLDTRIYKIRNS